MNDRQLTDVVDELKALNNTVGLMKKQLQELVNKSRTTKSISPTPNYETRGKDVAAPTKKGRARK